MKSLLQCQCLSGGVGHHIFIDRHERCLSIALSLTCGNAVKVFIIMELWRSWRMVDILPDITHPMGLSIFPTRREKGTQCVTETAGQVISEKLVFYCVSSHFTDEAMK